MPLYFYKGKMIKGEVLAEDYTWINVGQTRKDFLRYGKFKLNKSSQTLYGQRT